MHVVEKIENDTANVDQTWKFKIQQEQHAWFLYSAFSRQSSTFQN